MHLYFEFAAIYSNIPTHKYMYMIWYDPQSTIDIEKSSALFFFFAFQVS